MNPRKWSRRNVLKQSAAGAAALAMTRTRVARGQSTGNKVQLGIIGCGARARQLMPELLDQCPDARIAAVCDLIEERYKSFQKMAERDYPTGYVDFRKMLDKEKLDGVLVVTQPNAHAEVVVPVLDAGFHTFAEKPMDITVEAIDAITKSARKAWKDNGVLYQIGTQRRYHPSYMTGVGEIHKGLIGDVNFIQGQWHWRWEVGKRKVDRDGGRFIEQASHHTDVASWVAGDMPPTHCTSMGGTHLKDLDGGPNMYSETYSATSFMFPNDIVFSYTHLFGLPRRFQAEKMWVFGKKGGVDLVKGQFFRYEPPGEIHAKMQAEQKGEKTDFPPTRVTIAEDSGTDWHKGTREELQDFVENIKTGAKRMPNANVETGRICSLMCMMARKAMVNEKKNAYEPRMVTWKDLGSTA